MDEIREWIAGLTDSQRTTYGVLTAIILLTLPCYCLGLVALAIAPPAEVPTLPPTSTRKFGLNNSSTNCVHPANTRPVSTRAAAERFHLRLLTVIIVSVLDTRA